MRSRYCAFAVGDTGYLYRTWHPRTRPHDVVPVPGITWTGLEVLHTEAGDASADTGTVEFRASYRAGEKTHVLHATSRFERRAGRWVYVDDVS
jgi:uncharacterized protein YchJ